MGGLCPALGLAPHALTCAAVQLGRQVSDAARAHPVQGLRGALQRRKALEAGLLLLGQRLALEEIFACPKKRVIVSGSAQNARPSRKKASIRQSPQATSLQAGPDSSLVNFSRSGC